MKRLHMRVCGIPAIVQVSSYVYQASFRGSPHLCDSDVDYKGYEDFEFEILDRKGRPAAWLERKLTKAEKYAIELAISKDAEEERLNYGY